jgi:hypothetical protein
MTAGGVSEIMEGLGGARLMWDIWPYHWHALSARPPYGSGHRCSIFGREKERKVRKPASLAVEDRRESGMNVLPRQGFFIFSILPPFLLRFKFQ